MLDQALVLDEVVFRYCENGPFVFEQLSFSVNRGEYVAILGPNGTGKSTLARLIHGMLEPTCGEVRIEGEFIPKSSNGGDFHQQVGLVFQNPDSQMVATSVIDEIAFGLCNLQMEPEGIHQRVEEALDRFNLTHLQERPLHLLSGGEKRRVTLASVWAIRPWFWVLDEPIAMLDAATRRSTLELIRELHREGETLIYLGHRLDEVMEADRVFVLWNGGIAWSGSPRQLIEDMQSEWGIALPPAARLWRTVGLRYQSNRFVATTEELVEALWDCAFKMSR